MTSTFRFPRMLALCAVLCAPAVLLADDLDNLFRLREARTRRVSSSDQNWQNGNGDCRAIAPGATLTVADIKGPGIIRHIWFTIAADDPEYGRSLTLRMYWDGNDQPAVESPIGDFFAVGNGQLRVVKSLPVAVSSTGRAMNCYWPMPFHQNARITLTNDSKKYNVGCAFWYVDYEEVDALPPDTALFNAQYRQEYPAQMGRDYLILDAEGRGHYVGTVLSVRTRTASWFGEGDDRFYIDGETEPSLRGTGTEDYFCDAWGFKDVDQLYYGVVMGAWENMGAYISVYRWHINDPVHFRTSLKVTIEHKGVMFNDKGQVISGFMERPDLFASVAYWYQTGQAKRYATLPPAEERVVPRYAAEFETLAKAFKPTPADTQLQVQDGGYSEGKQVLAQFTKPDGVLAVPFKLDKPHAGLAYLKLTRSFDYGQWRVSLDGKVLPGMDRLDLYASTVVPSSFDLGALDLAAGEHTLKFECLGKNVDSKGYFLGVDALTIQEITPYVAKSGQ